MTAIYSVLHLLVDGMCALAMFGRFLPRGNGHLYILLYNFCAFSLQMPFGVALDALCGSGKERRGEVPFLFAAAGVLCTIAGVFTHPVILGIGNALFHVGGGVGASLTIIRLDGPGPVRAPEHETEVEAEMEFDYE